jgi:hypothetical protein
VVLLDELTPGVDELRRAAVVDVARVDQGVVPANVDQLLGGFRLEVVELLANLRPPQLGDRVGDETLPCRIELGRGRLLLAGALRAVASW